MKRVLLHQTGFGGVLGGVDYLPLMFIAELQKHCEVTLALNWRSDIERASRMAGIPVDLSRLKVELIKPRSRLLRRLDAVLPFYRTRRLKALAREADICISAVNVFDFGKPAHHFIYLLRHFGDDAFSDYFMHRPPKTGSRLFYRRFRTCVAEYILRPLLGMRSTRRILADPREHIYPNSRYVERVMKEFYGEFNSTVFYPPTTFELTGETVERDPLRVVYLGRNSRRSGFPPSSAWWSAPGNSPAGSWNCTSAGILIRIRMWKS